ncbi:MAG: hypothetical protein IKR97_00640, partial [Eubacterium sp.]|nr:hypothetical protein [Eubacterium sp.]
MEKLKYFVNGEFKDSKTEVWYDLHNPSTGEVTGQAPCCTNDATIDDVLKFCDNLGNNINKENLKQ